TGRDARRCHELRPPPGEEPRPDAPRGGGAEAAVEGEGSMTTSNGARPGAAGDRSGQEQGPFQGRPVAPAVAVAKVPLLRRGPADLGPARAGPADVGTGRAGPAGVGRPGGGLAGADLAGVGLRAVVARILDGVQRLPRPLPLRVHTDAEAHRDDRCD